MVSGLKGIKGRQNLPTTEMETFCMQFLFTLKTMFVVTQFIQICEGHRNLEFIL
jgi:hypothetical protein